MNDRTAASALPNLSKVLLRQPIWTVLVFSFMLMSLVACGSGMEGDPIISTSSTPTGATASLVWDPVPDPSVIAYNVHYGKQSAGQPGSCSYSNSQTVNSPPPRPSPDWSPTHAISSRSAPTMGSADPAPTKYPRSLRPLRHNRTRSPARPLSPAIDHHVSCTSVD